MKLSNSVFAFGLMILTGGANLASANPPVFPGQQPPVDVVNCAAAMPRPDAALQLRIRYLPGPMGITGAMPGNLVAQVGSRTFAGMQPVGQYPVIRRNPVAIAQPVVLFQGQGFNLEVITDPRTSVQGGFRAHLVAEANGARIAEELVCQLR